MSTSVNRILKDFEINRLNLKRLRFLKNFVSKSGMISNKKFKSVVSAKNETACYLSDIRWGILYKMVPYEFAEVSYAP